MDLRETVEVTTPLTNKKIILKGYVNGRIKQAISAALFGDSTFSAGDPKSATFSGKAIQDSTNVAFEQLVLSIDGSSDNILESILDLPEDDYEFVKTEVDKIQRPLVPKSEKPSPTATATPSTEE